MAISIYLKIDGVTGESTDKAHKGWIDVQSYSWGTTMTFDSTGNLSNRPEFTSLDLVLPSTMAAPQMVKLALGANYAKTAQLEVFHPLKGKAGAVGIAGKLHSFALTEVAVASYKMAAATVDVTPVDHATLVFRGQLTLTTTSVNANEWSLPAMPTAPAFPFSGWKTSSCAVFA